MPIPFIVWGRDKRFHFILGYYTSSFFQRSVNATLRKSSWNFLLFTGGEKYIDDSYSSLGAQETTRFYIPAKQLLILMILQFYYLLDLNLIRNRESNVQ
ncbi:hypothetical protein LEP1GSC064_2311 [Leptospira kirschneri serovar Grippotyphosa str. Moskva]|nr:hypothetical protein LEP1GSC064_2311 [Leptospira kirschneri serovar Grippotyphosa str. Moskva]